MSPPLAYARIDRGGWLEGCPAPGAGRRGAVLARFLESDVQGDLAHAETLLAEIGAAEDGAAPHPAMIGNAFSIAISPAGGVIDNVVVVGAPAERYALGELRAAIEGWADAIRQARNGEVEPA